MDPYLGEIRLFAGNYAPADWVLCDGQMLPIQTYSALYSLIGTAYGGDGASTFGVPNLNGRILVGTGVPVDSSNNYQLGLKGGAATVTLDEAKLPAHTHPLMASTANAEVTSPAGTMLADPSDQFNMYIPYQATAGFLALADDALLPAGGGQPHENRMPGLVMTYIMCVSGIYPTTD